jgi:predicted nucleic acid-binding protein
MMWISAAILPRGAPLTCRERLSARHQRPFGADQTRAQRSGTGLGCRPGQCFFVPERRLVGELRRGLTVLPQSKRRRQLEQWFEQYLLPLFASRILPVTQSVGNRWGVLGGECQLRGSPFNTADGMIAATALEGDLTLVTRNARDFAGLGVTVFNPWDAV